MDCAVGVSAAISLTAEVDVPEHLARGLRRADDLIRLAVTGTERGLLAAGTRRLAAGETGVYIGTAYGPLETNFTALDAIIFQGERQISPTVFSHSVFNSAAGYVSRLFDFRGPALTVTDYGWPFMAALEEGRLAVAGGRVKRAVVIGVETYSDLLADAYCRARGVSSPPWEKAAVVWVLEGLKARAEVNILTELGGVVCRMKPAEPLDYLTRRDEGWDGLRPDDHDRLHPLAAALFLTGAVAGFKKQSVRPARLNFWSAFGSVKVNF